MMNNDIYHHGILGQSWGKRNGPPYPLGGDDYSKEEKKQIYKARFKKNSIYNKKHFDQNISKKQVLTTLSYDKNRTKNTDMFYAAFNKWDKHQYNALFNKKIPQEIFDENGNSLGTAKCYKFRINNKLKKDIRVASEDSGADAFLDLYKKDRDFSNFVKDPNRMQSLFVNDKYKFKGYRESAEALDNIRNSETPRERDLRTAYRMFNYVIPSDGNGINVKAKDIATQRSKMFNSLKEKGYGAMLDTNDSIYGGFKTNSPVIVFDMKSVVPSDVNRVTVGSKRASELALVAKKFLGK